MTDSQTLDYIKRYWLEHCYSPAIGDIAEEFGKSKSVVRRQLQGMASKRLLKLVPDVARAIVPAGIKISFE